MPLIILSATIALVACRAPEPTQSPLLLPTRQATRTPLPPTQTPFGISAQDYYSEGMDRQTANDVTGALQSFSFAIQRDPGFALAYVARGTIHLAQHEIDLALNDADAALLVDPRSASAYALRGEALRLQGRARLSLRAFDQALKLDPTLQPETFRSRWLAARADLDADALLALSQEYRARHPDDPLSAYYRAWGWIEAGKPQVAIVTLGEGIEATPDPPALLWFALGEAYMRVLAWDEAVTSIEATRALIQAGDASLGLHSDRPVAALFGALGLAYLGAGRCVDAETMITYALDVGGLENEYAGALEQARICQTPTPTPTPHPTGTPWYR